MGAHRKSKKKTALANSFEQNSLQFISAASKGDIATIQTLLLRSRIDVNFKNNAAIKRAIEYGHTNTAMLLLADPRFRIGTLYQELFNSAVHAGNVTIVQFFLQQSHITIDAATANNQPIKTAAVHGHVEIMRLLLSCPGVDPAADDNAPIQHAVGWNRVEAARLLLSTDIRVDPTCHEDYLLPLAVREGYIDMVRLLLADSRIDPSSSYNMSIIRAAQRNQIEVARLLLADARVKPIAAVSRAATNEMRNLLIKEHNARELSIDFDMVDLIAEFGLSKLVTAQIYEFIDLPLSIQHHKKYTEKVYQHLNKE